MISGRVLPSLTFFLGAPTEAVSKKYSEQIFGSFFALKFRETRIKTYRNFFEDVRKTPMCTVHGRHPMCTVPSLCTVDKGGVFRARNTWGVSSVQKGRKRWWEY